jgi:nitrate reductase delta subunit
MTSHAPKEEIHMNCPSVYFKIVSLLMQYPDDAYFNALPELQSAAAQLPAGPGRTGIAAFLADFRTRSALQLQERYTALFDLNPATTLNLSYHLWGDSEDRANLLTRLQQCYASAGFEKTSAELPDFLPMVLEFMSVIADHNDHEAVRQCFDGFQTVVGRIRKIAPPYADLLLPLADIFKDQPRDRID